jgi:hypothetical protein
MTTAVTSRVEWGTEIPGGYFDEERHLYRDEAGLIVPSTTQVFDILGCSDFNNVQPAVLEFKRDYGTAMHLCVEYLIRKELDWDTVDDRLISPVTGVEGYLKKWEYEGVASEEQRVHSLFGMKYGMTLDHRGTMLYRGVRRHVLWDLKSGVKFSPTWFWQLGAYLHPQEKAPGGWLGIIIQVQPDGRVIPHYLEDTERYKREFQVLLSAAILKLNAGLARIGKS